jgi:hypothetical protein
MHRLNEASSLGYGELVSIEPPLAPPPIQAGASGTAGFADPSAPGLEKPQLITSAAGQSTASEVGRMVHGFFANGGARAYLASSIDALEEIDEVELLCPLPIASNAAIDQCERRRDRIAIVSLPTGPLSPGAAQTELPLARSAFAAVHHPWLRTEAGLTPPGGHVAGIYAAGGGPPPTERDILGLSVPPLEHSLSSGEVNSLLSDSVNPIRELPGVRVRVWSTLTLEPGPDAPSLVVRRLLVHLEKTIAHGTQWAVFEPNGPPLWAAVRQVVEDFLTEQWHAGALAGDRPTKAYFVRCDRSTMTQNDLDNGRLVCLVGVAPLRPAEFVIFRIGQWTADRRP